MLQLFNLQPAHANDVVHGNEEISLLAVFRVVVGVNGDPGSAYENLGIRRARLLGFKTVTICVR